MKTKCIALAAAVGMFLVLSGCDRSRPELEKTQTELSAAKTNLTKAQAALADMQKERDTLKETLEKTKAEAASAVQSHNQLQQQIDAITKEKADAVARVTAESKTTTEKLMSQLQGQTQKALDLENQVKKLQALVDQLKGTTGLPTPKL